MKIIGSLFLSALILSQVGGLRILTEAFSRASELNHVLQLAIQVSK